MKLTIVATLLLAVLAGSAQAQTSVSPASEVIPHERLARLAKAAINREDGTAMMDGCRRAVKEARASGFATCSATLPSLVVDGEQMTRAEIDAYWKILLTAWMKRELSEELKMTSTGNATFIRLSGHRGNTFEIRRQN